MPTPKQLLSTLTERGTCSAEDLATAMGCPVRHVLRMVHVAWWPCEQIAGPRGWLYRKRIFHKAHAPFVARKEGEE